MGLFKSSDKGFKKLKPLNNILDKSERSIVTAEYVRQSMLRNEKLSEEHRKKTEAYMKEHPEKRLVSPFEEAKKWAKDESKRYGQEAAKRRKQ